MKKILVIFTLIVFFLFSFSNILAFDGQNCMNILGGDCKPECDDQTENSVGMQDCKQSGVVGGSVCCVPKSAPPTKVSCGDPCLTAAQCPSRCQACQELVRGQGKICRDCPATGCKITPAPINYCGRSCWGDDNNCGDPCPHCVPYGYAGVSWCQAEEISPAPGPGGGEAGSIRTAIGDIDPNNLQGFIQSLLGIAFGVAGGIAFLLMLFGSFQIMTSSGNPEKMKAGSELITSALTGLLFIIFSVFLLKLIGVTILDIPGLKP